MIYIETIMAIKEEPKNLHHIVVFIASIVGPKFSVYATS